MVILGLYFTVKPGKDLDGKEIRGAAAIYQSLD
jgi:hypothetical protein